LVGWRTGTWHQSGYFTEITHNMLFRKQLKLASNTLDQIPLAGRINRAQPICSFGRGIGAHIRKEDRQQKYRAWEWFSRPGIHGVYTPGELRN